ncbi:mannonate dehydratase [Pleomorphovibrio marinus]|uniref:mannonate dehydratase n=1 Tax=Pleomorphovibrio marinus TaxID=2164132 RepID=UPI000E0B0118|nr:mannonate dehydratase [Pleomorphovibrio marinus]
MSLIESWRWFGPNDPVSLSDIRQAGATSVVSALHHVPHGEVWTRQEIEQRKKIITEAGLEWSIVESVPVHEAIKTRNKDCEKYLENYRESLRNLAANGIHTICYNFMPVLDWTRTDLNFRLPTGAIGLRFDWTDLAVFDVKVLERKGADRDYPREVLQEVPFRFSQMGSKRLEELKEIILMGVPTEKGISVETLRESISIYEEIGKKGLRENWAYFMRAIQDTCEEEGLTMTMHPDDPPYAILGLPRMVSNLEDLLFLIQEIPSAHNGICFCTGSLGAGVNNNLPEILEKVGHRVHFAHLRNVEKDMMGNFHESDHLAGDVDMVKIVRQLLALSKQRGASIPFRPDHGHQLLDDLGKTVNPGYPAIGRLRGLAELRGAIYGLEKL